MKTPRKKARGPRRKRSPDLSAWTRAAERVLDAVVIRARAIPSLKKKVSAPEWTIEIEVVGQAKMRQLNREARGKDRPTDVLSFELPAGFRKQGLLGSLVICLPVLKAQARAHKHPQSQELEVLIAHGLLHLLGFDHEKGLHFARMMGRMERRLLGQAIGHPIGLIQR